MVPLFFITAIVYSIVGLGGGSTYLALLALSSLPYQTIPKVALLCNIVVVTGGFYHFYKVGYFSPKKTFPFIISSIPAAYLGGSFSISKTAFLWLLSSILFVVALRMFFSIKDSPSSPSKDVSTKTAYLLGIPIGAVLGFVSGVVGIGGGIFLLPTLFFLRWSHVKEAAAAASFFILVNSISGLLGHLSKGYWNLETSLLLPLALTVFVGGQIGSRLGAKKISRLAIQRITATIILSVSLRIFWKLLM